MNIGSKLKKDVARYSIVGGVPANDNKKRFEQNQVHQFLDWKWWKLPLSALKRLAPRFRVKSSLSLGDL